MLVQFTCDAYESLTYFENVAHQLLSLMGHSGTIPSALVQKDIPQALEKLQRGIQENSNADASKQNTTLNEENDEEPVISLKHRALPLINLLQAAVENECNVHWDYV